MSKYNPCIGEENSLFVYMFFERCNWSWNNLLFRYLNIYVGLPDVEESFNVTRPVSPHEVITYLTVTEFVCLSFRVCAPNICS